MLTIAQIAVVVAAGGLASLSESQFSDAAHSVRFAIDPFHLGEEPHLVLHVDRCGFDDDALVAIDQAVWAEEARRNDALHAARWLAPAALPLAA